MLQVGDKLGPYELVAPLSKGGMATLMLARQRGLGGFSRLVALKFVHKERANEALAANADVVGLLLKEARLTAQVNHPNVVHVEEVGAHHGTHYIAMEYVHGVTISDLTKRLGQLARRMAPCLCVHLAAQIAEALHAAHAATSHQGEPLRIVHRDVSPQNVMLTHTGHLKLIDFGIAKSARPHSGHNQNLSCVVGKLRYMAPEQLTCEAMDQRTDVYGLAVVLWELLTGRPLFRPLRNSDHYAAHWREINPPSRYVPDLPRAVDSAVLKALSPKPDQRFATVLQFRRALLQAMPEAAVVDAPKVARVLGAAVGADLQGLRNCLPEEFRLQLGGTHPHTADTSDIVDQLLVDNVVTPIDSTPERRQLRAADWVETSLPTRVQASFGTSTSEPQLQSGPQLSSIEADAPNVADEYSSPQLLGDFFQGLRQTALAHVAFALMGLLCAVLGVALGRATVAATPTAPVAAQTAAHTHGSRSGTPPLSSPAIGPLAASQSPRFLTPPRAGWYGLHAGSRRTAAWEDRSRSAPALKPQ